MSDPVFFPNLSKFCRACAPDVLTPAQLARIERGELLHGESTRVRNLNTLADEWATAREVFAQGSAGKLSGADLDECAWQFVRTRCGFLTEPERARIEVLDKKAREHMGQVRSRPLL